MRLGVSVALEHAARSGAQWEDVAGSVESLRAERLHAGEEAPLGSGAARAPKRRGRTGSARARKVAARSAAEMPVVVPALRSTDTVKAVPFGSWLRETMGGSRRSSQRSPGSATHITPEEWRTTKPTVSAVASSPARIRSPSFSRDSSSVTTMG